MNKKIGILHLEDSFRDSELIHTLIESWEIGHDYFLADNKKDFINFLKTENIDIILSDYSLPDYNGYEALRFTREEYPHIPFIFVSGTIGEDAAINAMLNGATDYVVKNKLERLVPAIKRALNEHELQLKRNQAEQEIFRLNRIYVVLSNVNHAVVRNIDKDELYKQVCQIAIDNGKFIMSWIGRIDNETHKVVVLASAGNIGHLDKLNIDLSDEKLNNGPTGIAIKSGHLVISTDIKNDESMTPWREALVNHGCKSSIALPLIVFGKVYGTLNLYSNEVDFFDNDEIKLLEELAMDISFAIEFIDNTAERKRAEQELILANKELAFQNQEKEKRAVELISAKEHAEESDRLKSAFLANMSHEFRTPMNGILSFTELLKEPNLTGDDQQEYIHIIEDSGNRMLNLIDNIICISQIESKQSEISISETNINEQIKSIYSNFKTEVGQKGIEISFKNSLHEEKSMIYSDPKIINTIISNLLKNAIKFTHKGQIYFGYIKKGKFLEFFVKDTGVGICKEHQKVIFERFRQVSESISRDYEGAGLGLSISKAYVEMLGGKIWIKSELGKGSTIYFTIPYNAEPEEKIANKNIILKKKLSQNRLCTI